MIPKDLFSKIRRIEITTSRLVTDILAGQYHSVFKGQGIEFDEVRDYDTSDDVRSIDWNVTARTGKLHVKKFVEERELTVMILVDVSFSSRFASVNALKSQIAAEISAILAFSAIRNQDKVGLIIFSDQIEKFVPPRKGRRHVLRLIREILYYKPEGKKTDIVQALEYLNKVTTRKTISFIISDFFENPSKIAQTAIKRNLKKTLAMVNKRHDTIAITLNDPLEMNLPNCGLIALEDPETNETFKIDSSDQRFRQQYREQNQKRIKAREQLFSSAGVDFINVSTDMNYMTAIEKFFYKRKRR